MRVLGLVALGGALGGVARYGVTSASGSPWTVLAVNALGCLLIGVLMGGPLRAHPRWRPFLGVGVLGGWTTFSAYAVDVVALLRAGRAAEALAYLAVTPLLALAAVAAGLALARRARGARR